MCHMTSAANVMRRTVSGAAILIASGDVSVAQTASQQNMEKASGIGQSALSAGLDQGRLCCPLIAKQPHGTAGCDGADLSFARS